MSRIDLASGAGLGLVQDAFAIPELLALPIDVLMTDGVLDCQLFLKMAGGNFVKYGEPGLVINKRAKQRLIDNGRRELYIRTDEGTRLHKYLEANLKHTLVNATIPPEKKAEVLFVTSTFVAKSLTSNPRSPEAVRSARSMVDSAMDFVFKQPSALRFVLAVSSYDYYTFTHSVNVMTYAISLARILGYNITAELQSLGLAALVHDVGKAYISPLIVLKTGPLSEDEFTEMKKHPELGFDALQDTGEMAADELLVVHHHHEKLNGQGYPFGLSANHIDDRVRIITCVDMYDALTTRRTYREALSPYQALSIMKKLVGEELDRTVYKGFVTLIGEI